VRENKMLYYRLDESEYTGETEKIGDLLEEYLYPIYRDVGLDGSTVDVTDEDHKKYSGLKFCVRQMQRL